MYDDMPSRTPMLPHPLLSAVHHWYTMAYTVAKPHGPAKCSLSLTHTCFDDACVDAMTSETRHYATFFGASHGHTTLCTMVSQEHSILQYDGDWAQSQHKLA